MTRFTWHLLAVGVVTAALAGCGTAARPDATRAALPVATAPPAAAAAPEAAGAGEGGEEPSAVFVDSAGRFSFEHPQSWGQATQPGEDIRFTGRDEFVSVTVANSPLNPMDFANTDASALASSSRGFKGQPVARFQIASTSGAVLAYSWEAGPSPVTAKMVPSSAKRYYLPGPSGTLAILTYSSPVQLYDPEGADDLARTFKWLR